MIRPVVLLFLLLAQMCAMLQKVHGQSDILWNELEITQALNDDLELIGVKTWRQSLTETNWRRHTLDFTVNYIFKSFEFRTGLRNFYTLDEEEQIFELRPWQGVVLNYPSWDRAEFVNFVRFEERFQLQNNAWSFSPRLRYQLSTRIALTGPKLEDHTLYFYGFAEWLYNFNQPLDERFSNERSVGAGLGYMFSKKSSIELTYESDLAFNTLEEDILESDVRIIRVTWMYAL